MEAIRSTLQTASGDQYAIYDLSELVGEEGLGRLPYTVKILLENALRNQDGEQFRREHIEALAGYDGTSRGQELPFKPGRVLIQDLTGVPALVDLAALRSALVQMGGDGGGVSPSLRVDLVMDHSVQVDAFGSPEAMAFNQKLEFQRNIERYRFIKWGEAAFEQLRVVPPGMGIVHQVNLEYLADVVSVAQQRDGLPLAYPDTLVGADSHTTMINGLGVVGWGVGGIEAEACMLGQAISLVLPEVVGVELRGAQVEGVTSTDLVLALTEMLRKLGVVGKFVEFYGEGLAHLSVADRATLANMAPEYGATVAAFPIDDQTLSYLALTGRREEQIERVEAYARRQGLWAHDGEGVAYSTRARLDLSTIEPALAGPKRPQDRIALGQMQESWREHLGSEARREPRGIPLASGEALRDGAVVIAAITSCTNTSNPSVMIAAGLLAQKAHKLGLRAKPWVKTSLAPGSRVVTDYLEHAGLHEGLEALGFYTVGYGCTTCIGNTGPLDAGIVDAIEAGELWVCSVLSGNRNFEGRISPHTRGNYLASPPLVVAYALAGTVDIDLHGDPLGHAPDGAPVYLRDLWPSHAEIAEVLASSVRRSHFVDRYSDTHIGPDAWRELEVEHSSLYDWAPSTYIQRPPFFAQLSPEPEAIVPILGARCLVKAGDATTTDHISPAGAIPLDSPAAQYLRDHQVEAADFNTYGARRGNDRVMIRGTFGNVRFQNQLVPEKRGGYTRYLGPGPEPTRELVYAAHSSPAPGELCSIYDASLKYQGHGIPLIVLAGRDYGMGSSRDWAAKGPQLLGVRAVIAASFERIHRSNLLGMGILPLQFVDGEDADSLGLTGLESYDIPLDESLAPGLQLQLQFRTTQGQTGSFSTRVRIDSQVELEYYKHGGILHAVLRKMLASQARL